MAAAPTQAPTLPAVDAAGEGVAAATLAPVVAEPAPVAEPQEGGGGGNLNPFVCTGGCAEPPDPSCAIKGNVNSRKDRIYHMPGWRDYDRTTIKPEEGDRWFCTEQEAIDAGFRAPLNS